MYSNTRTRNSFAWALVSLSLCLGVSHAAEPIQGGIWPLAEWYGRQADYGYNSFTLFDPVHDHAYIVADIAERRLVKLALGDGDALPAKVAETAFAGVGPIECGVLDADHGYAYLVVRSETGGRASIVKFALGSGNDAPRYVGTTTFGAPDDDPNLAFIDSARGYVCVVTTEGDTQNPDRLTKFTLGAGDALPAFVGDVVLPRRGYRQGDVDVVQGYAYLGGSLKNEEVAKVRLGDTAAPPVLVGAVDLVGFIQSLKVSSSDGLGYLGLAAPWVSVFRLGDGDEMPSIVGSGTLPDSPGNIVAGSIDTVNGNLYYLTSKHVVKVALGPTRTAPHSAGVFMLTSPQPGQENETYRNYQSFADPDDGHVYFVGNTLGSLNGVSHQIAKVRAGAADAPPELIGVKRLDDAEASFSAGATDLATRRFYLGTTDGKLRKFALPDGLGMPVEIGSADLNLPGLVEVPPATVLLDGAEGYGYVQVGSEDEATGSLDFRLVKVALGAPDEAPRTVGSLGNTPGFATGSVIDPSRSVALIAKTDILKVHLGQGEEPPTAGPRIFVGGFVTAGVIDSSRGYAYFSTEPFGDGPVEILKVAYGDSDSSLTIESRLTLSIEERPIPAGFIDEAGEYSYWYGGPSAGRIVKVANGEGGLPLRQVATLELGLAYPIFRGPVPLDSARGIAYVVAGGGIDARRILAVSLGAGDAPPTVLRDITTVPTGGPRWETLSYDPLWQQIFVAEGHYGEIPPRILKYSVGGQHNRVQGSKFLLPERAETVTGVRLLTRVAGGKLRLAIYDDSEFKRLLWQSGEIANGGGEVVAAIADGTPASLSLAPGSYWTAWQTDYTEPVVEPVPGALGEGLAFEQAFGPAADPLPFTKTVPTDEKWPQYLLYSTESGQDAWLVF